MALALLLHMEVEVYQDFAAMIMLMYVKLFIVLCRAVGTLYLGLFETLVSDVFLVIHYFSLIGIVVVFQFSTSFCMAQQ